MSQIELAPDGAGIHAGASAAWPSDRLRLPAQRVADVLRELDAGFVVAASGQEFGRRGRTGKRSERVPQ